jgi:hypothetical protein
MKVKYSKNTYSTLSLPNIPLYFINIYFENHCRASCRRAGGGTANPLPMHRDTRRRLLGGKEWRITPLFTTSL